MNKQNEVNIYNGMSFSHKKEWNLDTYYTVDEPWRHGHIQKDKCMIHVFVWNTETYIKHWEYLDA